MTENFFLGLAREKIFRYFIVGGISTAIDFVIFFSLIEFFNFHWFYSSLVSFNISTIFNYFLSITFVFISGVKFGRGKEFFFVFLVSIIGLIINQIFLYILINCIFMNLFLSKIITTGIVFSWNYFSRLFLVFNDNSSIF